MLIHFEGTLKVVREREHFVAQGMDGWKERRRRCQTDTVYIKLKGKRRKKIKELMPTIHRKKNCIKNVYRAH
jgi:allantoicase